MIRKGERTIPIIDLATLMALYGPSIALQVVNKTGRIGVGPPSKILKHQTSLPTQISRRSPVFVSALLQLTFVRTLVISKDYCSSFYGNVRLHESTEDLLSTSCPQANVLILSSPMSGTKLWKHYRRTMIQWTMSNGLVSGS